MPELIKYHEFGCDGGGEQYLFTINSSKYDYFSVVRHTGSYGYEEGFYELAYMDSLNRAVYIIGWLTVPAVEMIVTKENCKKVL